MEDCETYSFYVEPTKIKKIEEVYQGYTYFQENDLIIAKITPCFENEDGKSTMTGSAGQQRINTDFIGNYSIPFPSLEIQKELIKELELEEKAVVKPKSTPQPIKTLPPQQLGDIRYCLRELALMDNRPPQQMLSPTDQVKYDSLKKRLKELKEESIDSVRAGDINQLQELVRQAKI
ncbi:15216_t:CDS:2 [Funneliformis geosporum]|nr:15216_t:CDS:2 [Funneliformis geosporum]